MSLVSSPRLANYTVSIRNSLVAATPLLSNLSNALYKEKMNDIGLSYLLNYKLRRITTGYGRGGAGVPMARTSNYSL